MQHRHIFGAHDLYRVDNKEIDSAPASELDHVALPYVFEAPKKTVTVARDREIAARARLRGSKNAPDATVQRDFVCTVEHGNFQVNLGNAQNRQRSVHFLQKAVLVCLNSPDRPGRKSNLRDRG